MNGCNLALIRQSLHFLNIILAVLAFHRQCIPDQFDRNIAPYMVFGQPGKTIVARINNTAAAMGKQGGWSCEAGATCCSQLTHSCSSRTASFVVYQFGVRLLSIAFVFSSVL